MRNNFFRPSMRSFILFALFVAMISLSSAAQQSTPVQQRKFRVSGTVMGGGSPVARARVFLSNVKNPQNKRSTIASDEGHFEFNQIPTGKYSLEGAKRGYVTQAYDQHDQFSTAIVTGAGIDTENLILSLMPAAILTVKVVDENAEPVRRATVTLHREDHRLGTHRVVNIATSTTDDLGECEFQRLLAGSYFVSVRATPWYAIHPPSRPPEGQSPFTPTADAVDASSFDVTYPITYFGDVTDSESASPLIIKSGDRAQVEIHLNPVTALHILVHATANGQQGIALPSLQQSIFGNSVYAQNNGSQQITPGVFEISGVAPGKYEIAISRLGPDIRGAHNQRARCN